MSASQQPVLGKDYPRTWSQFLDWFATEEACLAYLERLRWPTGFVCPHCGTAAHPGRASRSRLICRACRHQSSVTAGTIFDKTRTPLRIWLGAAWYVTNQKQGVSALGLQRVLGLNSYQTAWTMLHRLRRAMVRPGREQLKGNVEVDETYIAITERGKRRSRAGRKSHTTKTLVACAVEIVDPKGFGRIRLRRIRMDSERYLLPFVREVVAPGSMVHTDGSPAYRSLPSKATGMNDTSWPARPPPRMPRCLACIAWPRWSSAGCWEPIMARCSQTNSTPIWMSLSFASIVARPARAACCSIDCSSRPW